MLFWTVLITTLLLLGGLYLREASLRRSHPVTGGPHPERNVAYVDEFELYSNSFSHCSRKVRLALAEIGLPVLHHAIDLIETGSYQTISPAYLRVNPAGVVPTLVHRGCPIYESDDILAYATANAPKDAPALVPDSPELFTRMRYWLDRANLPNEFGPEQQRVSAGACVPGLTLPIFITAIRHIPLVKILPGLLFHPHKERPVFFFLARLFGLRLCGNQPFQRIIRTARATSSLISWHWRPSSQRAALI